MCVDGPQEVQGTAILGTVNTSFLIRAADPIQPVDSCLRAAHLFNDSSAAKLRGHSLTRLRCRPTQSRP
jgi:hypothetical protein